MTKRRRMTGKWLAGVALAVGFLSPCLCWALVRTMPQGHWPETWPKELEAYRKQAKTIDVAHGIQETVYEIQFDKREDFEKAWPAILKVKDKGAPLITSSPSYYDKSGSSSTMGVRILCPASGTSGRPGGKKLETGGPWPDSLKSPSGVLPEYVVHSEKDEWVPYDGTNRRGFINRARIDIELITDGSIIDLNRIRLPADTPIIDKRKLEPDKTDAKTGL